MSCIELDSFLVPVDSEITVSPRSDDYEYFTHEQFQLQNLPINDQSLSTNVFRILSWQEVIVSLIWHLPTTVVRQN